MPESNTRGDAAGDDELATMCCAMMRATKGCQVVSMMPAALRTQLDMMCIEKLGVAATRDDALLVIAAPYCSARRR
ncbi:MAG TPA: hypothetical protein VH062_17790 [Polyangiaceae bacterium]|jgi:hypothetical protein|nr:hypothetical protein [Polyangiaceae bacterium]